MATGTSAHLPTQRFIHVGLIAFASRLEPGQNVSVNAQTNLPLDGPVESTDLDPRRNGLCCWGICVINFRIRLGSNPLEFLTLAGGKRSRKELARGEQPFARR